MPGINIKPVIAIPTIRIEGVARPLLEEIIHMIDEIKENYELTQRVNAFIAFAEEYIELQNYYPASLILSEAEKEVHDVFREIGFVEATKCLIRVARSLNKINPVGADIFIYQILAVIFYAEDYLEKTKALILLAKAFQEFKFVGWEEKVKQCLDQVDLDESNPFSLELISEISNLYTDIKLTETAERIFENFYLPYIR